MLSLRPAMFCVAFAALPHAATFEGQPAIVLQNGHAWTNGTRVLKLTSA